MSETTDRSTTKKYCTPYKGPYHVVEGGSLPEGHSPSGWRGYRPNLWRDLYECCSDIECQANVRRDYRMWERGRIHEGLDELHNAVTRFDHDELKDFIEKYPEAVQLLNEFATIEELRILKP